MGAVRSNHRDARIDDCLTDRQGVLLIEDVPAPPLVEQCGSPLFVTSEDQSRRNVRRYAAAFGTAWSRRGVANRMGAASTMLADVVGCSCFADRLLPSVPGLVRGGRP